jgi:hypothetical protein
MGFFFYQPNVKDGSADEMHILRFFAYFFHRILINYQQVIFRFYIILFKTEGTIALRTG